MTQKAIRRELLGPLVCIAAMLVGCQKSDPPPPAGNAGDPKAQIYSYLARKAGQKSFAPGIDLNLPMHVATLRSNAAVLERRTTELRESLRAAGQSENSAEQQRRAALEGDLQKIEREWEAARVEAARRQEELSNQEDTYIRSVREQMAGIRSYETLYRLVGEQLATADRLLAEPDVARRRMGVKIAREACGHVNSDSVDVWLAARICEAYFWPNLDWVDPTPGSTERALELLETARRVFFNTHETNSVLTNYHLLQARAPNPRAADTYRVQLADWLEEKRNLKHAAEILDEIRDAEVLASAKERITRVKGGVVASQ